MQNVETVTFTLDGKKKTISLVEVVPENGEEPQHICKYFIINALGNAVFIKTSDRNIAKMAIDIYYGKDHYTVRTLKQEAPRGDVTVRATQTRRGQYVQNQRSKILNS